MGWDTTQQQDAVVSTSSESESSEEDEPDYAPPKKKKVDFLQRVRPGGGAGGVGRRSTERLLTWSGVHRCVGVSCASLTQEETPLFVRRGEKIAYARGRRGGVSKHEADGRVVYHKCKHCGLRLARLRCINCGQVQCEECCIWLHKQASRRHHKVKPLASRATTTGVDIRDPLRLQEDLLRSNVAVAQELVTKHHHKCVCPCRRCEGR